MNRRFDLLLVGAALSAISASTVSPAFAGAPTEERTSEQSVELLAESQHRSNDEGSLSMLRGTFSAVEGDTTVVLTVAIGERDGPGPSETAIGVAGTIYHRFSADVSTRTHIGLAEDEPVFATRDIAQDVTFRILPDTTATLGARWAQYWGSQDVYFLSASVRRYFEGGSVSYRLSFVDPDDRDSFVAHLANIVLNDASGEGKTQLWLSAGAASIETSQLQDSFSGEDYGVFVRRLQPLSEELNLVGSIGLSSYDRPVDRVTATSIGLGVELVF